VRNEKAGDFLALLKEWDALCKKYIVQKDITIESEVAQSLTDDEDEPVSEEIFEVEKLLDICYGDPNSTGQVGLWFKVLKT
jgi:DNA (cytosine-5)-methyltransferase 1